MDRSILLSLCRSLARHRLYTALNIGGLAVGIAIFLVLGLYIHFENSFEKWLPYHDEIYLVETEWKVPGSPFTGPSKSTMAGLLEQLRDDYPNVVGTRILGGENGGIVRRGDMLVNDDVALVDPSFLDVFEFEIVGGSGEGALDDPSAALISQSAAMRYFGSEDPVGQTLNVSYDDPKEYRIAGVFEDIPPNSDLTFDILLPIPDEMGRGNPNWFNWGSTSLQTYLRFSDSGEARAFESSLPEFVDRRARADIGEGASEVLKIKLQPLAEVHLQTEGSTQGSAATILLTLGLVGTFALLIAIINYVNLATARAGLRAREVAMRKVLGADRRSIMRQFLAEALLVVAIAAILGLILAELGLPFINATSGLELSIPYQVVLPGLVVLVAAVGLMAGFYPAIVLSGYDPATVLASSRSPSGGRSGARVREGLVLAQFSLAITFLIATAVIAAQAAHVKDSDLGFGRSGLLAVLSLRDEQVDETQKRAFLQAVDTLPMVRSAAIADTVVGGSGSRSGDNVPLPGVPGEGPTLVWEIVGPGYFETYGTALLAGRLFDANRPSDDSFTVTDDSAVIPAEQSIVINRSAVQTLGFTSPEDAVGQTVGGDRPRTIIGVVDDMAFFGPREAVEPGYYLFASDPAKLDTTVASIRFTGEASAAIAAVEQAWRRTIPQVPFNARTADERLSELYESDDRTMRLFSIGALLAVLIGCIGLWGLASFNTARRLREIGIRKSLGASSRDIVKLMVGQFLRPVLVANLIAWPIAWLLMTDWLAGFADRVTLSWSYFIVAGLLAIAIAFLTVLGQALRAGRTSPAWALRHD